MHLIKPTSTTALYLALATCLSLALPHPAQAQTSEVSETNTTDPQCSATAVSDQGNVSGVCVQPGGGPLQAYYDAAGATTQTFLSPAATGDSCKAVAVSNPALLGLVALSSPVVTGVCRTVAGTFYTAQWNTGTNALTTIAPLNNVAADVRPTATDAVGDVVLSNTTYDDPSTNTPSVTTPMISMSGSTTPYALPVPTGVVSSVCVAQDVADNALVVFGLGESNPVAVMNCQVESTDGTNTYGQAPYMAIGGLTLLGAAPSFTLKPLEIGSSSYCTVSGVTAAQAAVGTCYDSNGVASAAFWSNASAAPQLAPTTDSNGNALGYSYGRFINNSDEIVMTYADGYGNGQTAVWSPVSAGTLQTISPLDGGNSTRPHGFGDDGNVAFESATADGHVDGGVYTTSTGTSSLLTDTAGGVDVEPAAMSPSGQKVAVNQEDATEHDTVAVATYQ